jgi:LuxR family transcriptional regulator, maltose regulon positive regulatory protein
MMTYFLDTPLDSGEIYTPAGSTLARDTRPATREDVHLLHEKLQMPGTRGLIVRLRLNKFLGRSIAQFPATLISGRAGTGKTAVAASFARTQDRVAWYSVESSDAEWNVFAQYFAACVFRAVGSKAEVRDALPADLGASQSSIATFLIGVFAEAETALLHEPLLIVLDGIHHLFDAPWFGEFFSLLLSSLPESTGLLLLCRSKPPSPLWRLRSKQQLNVIDEKVLAFDLAETVKLCTKHGLKRSDAERAHAETFGRVSKLLERVKA